MHIDHRVRTLEKAGKQKAQVEEKVAKNAKTVKNQSVTINQKTTKMVSLIQKSICPI